MKLHSKYTLAYFAMVCLGCGDINAPRVPETNGRVSHPPLDPDPLYCEQRTIDLGWIPIGASNTEAEFSVTNQTNQQIRIASVERSCTCTEVRLSSEVVEPGESIHVTAEIKARSLGKQSATFNLQPAPVGKPVKFRLNWNGGSKLTVDPVRLSFGALTYGEAKTKQIHITLAADAQDVHWTGEDFQKVEGLPADQIFPKWEKTTDGVTVDVAVRPPLDPKVAHGLVIISPGGGIPKLRVPVDWNVSEPVTITPLTAFTGVLAAGQKWSTTFVISAADDTIRELQVVDATAEIQLTTSILDAQRVKCNLTGLAPPIDGAFRVPVQVDIVTDAAIRKRTLTVAGIVSQPPQ